MVNQSTEVTEIVFKIHFIYYSCDTTIYLYHTPKHSLTVVNQSTEVIDRF